MQRGLYQLQINKMAWKEKADLYPGAIVTSDRLYERKTWLPIPNEIANHLSRPDPKPLLNKQILMSYLY